MNFIIRNGSRSTNRTPNATPDSFEEIILAAKDAKGAKKGKNFGPRIYSDDKDLYGITNNALKQYVLCMFF